MGNSVYLKGNELLLDSDTASSQELFGNLIVQLKKVVRSGQPLNTEIIFDLHDGLKNGSEMALPSLSEGVILIPQGLKKVFPKSYHQAKFIQGMRNHDLSFGVGPAGTGKTYLAIAQALSEVLSKKRRKIVLTRPVVEAGESLGYLPGDLAQKINPYLRPLYDAMEDLLSPETLQKMEDHRMIEIAPLAYMRGRSLKNCFVVLDEAQNTTRSQMKMFLTRLGEGAKAVITGDVSQVDLPRVSESGLKHAQRLLQTIPEIHFSHFEKKDVVRNPLIKKIIEAYENDE